MTLVLLGTQNNDFHRLLQEVENNIENGNIKDKVIVQAGFTKYNSDKMEIFTMVSKDELDKLVEKSDLIITHAGVGSIEMSLEKGKKVIAVPRKKEYGEHVNDHQIEIEREFDSKGWIIGIDDVGKLGSALEEARSFTPNKYSGLDNLEMVNIIKSFIDKI
jgi:UDP-N-acetylglucosamine transferase subunit ALG13